MSNFFFGGGLCLFFSMPGFVLASELNNRNTIGYVMSNQATDLSRILQFNLDIRQPHQGVLYGIPKYFDWYKKPRISSINKTKDYGAIIGWGRIVWNGEHTPPFGEVLPSKNLVQIKNFQFLICVGKDRKWFLVQKGDISGAQFSTKFKKNIAKKASVQIVENGVATVRFDYGQVFHFWSKMGRTPLPLDKVHAVLVLMEARMVDQYKQPLEEGVNSYFLIGGGVDLWRGMRTKWDNFKSHTDLGVGRVKYIGSNWVWYGFSNAFNYDLTQLYQMGFYDLYEYKKAFVRDRLEKK